MNAGVAERERNGGETHPERDGEFAASDSRVAAREGAGAAPQQLLSRSITGL